MNGPVFTILYGIYIYVLLTLISGLFDGAYSNLILTVTLIIAIIYLISIVSERFWPNPVTRILTIISDILKGSSIYFILVTIAIYIASWILAIFEIVIPKDLIMALLFIVVPLISIYAVYNAYKIRVKHVELEFDNLTNPLNFIHISDVHIGSIRKEGLLKNIVKEINKLYEDNNETNGKKSDEIDFVVITGDLADGSSPIYEDSFKPLAKSKIPIYFTPGNHDFYPGISNVIKAADSANVITICNEMIDIKGTQLIGIPFGSFGFIDSTTKINSATESNDLTSKFVGVNNNDDNDNDDNNSDNSKSDEEVNYFNKNISKYYEGFDFEKIDKNKTSILLNHIPVAWDLFRKMGVDLVLSGHTHGGQFFPFNFLVKRAYPYLRGLYSDNGKYLYVSDGIGTLTPPLRLGTTAEMAFIHLKRK